MASLPYCDTSRLGEPSLDEILADPMVQLVMQRDGVADADMRRQIERLQHSLGTLHTLQ